VERHPDPLAPAPAGRSLTVLELPDAPASADLRTFVARARRLDDGAAVRLVAAGTVLAVYACALFGPATPTVLGLRVMPLAAPSEADETVPAAALADRLALIERRIAADRPAPGSPGAPVHLELPPVTPGASAAWAGLLPARSGWSVEGLLQVRDLREAARAGIEEVAAGTPAVAGAAAVGRLRAAVWGRPLLGDHPGVPAGVAFAAEAFGFLGPATAATEGAQEDAVTLHRNGRWWRLSTTRGHVLARPPSGL
jgi:hypothetical protein